MTELSLLDQKLIDLTNQYNNYKLKFADLEEEIEFLESKKYSLESTMNGIESEITKVRNRLIEIEIFEHELFSDDQFTNDFIKASFFACRVDEIKPGRIFSYINITDNEIWGCDVRRGIIIKNPNIPDELKNTLIRWDVRQDFVTNLNKSIERPYPDLKKVINNTKKQPHLLIEKIKASEFYDEFKVETVKEWSDKIIVKLNHLNTDMQLNKFFLDVALKCFENHQFNVFIKDSETPIVMESETISVIIVPMY